MDNVKYRMKKDAGRQSLVLQVVTKKEARKCGKYFRKSFVKSHPEKSSG